MNYEIHIPLPKWREDKGLIDEGETTPKRVFKENLKQLREGLIVDAIGKIRTILLTFLIIYINLTKPKCKRTFFFLFVLILG